MSHDQPPPSAGSGPSPDSIDLEDLPRQYGRYRILSLLGEGGMGRVFLCEIQGPSGFRKPAAIKVIRRDLATASSHRALVKEARLGGLLHHPNVVETYDFGERDGSPFIVMEHVDGCGLDELLAARGPLPAAPLLDLATQVCAGLHHAHELQDDGRPAGLIHRDLKPSNIMVGRNGVAKVMDFGVARAAMSGSTAGSGGDPLARGTPLYMSPEQAAARPMDRRSDLFSLGAILYELATGLKLFERESINAVIMAVVQVDLALQDPATLGRVAGQVPGLDAVLRRCLASDRHLRFVDAAELGRSLEALRPGAPPGPTLASLTLDSRPSAPRTAPRAPAPPVEVLIPRATAPPTPTPTPARAQPSPARAPLPPSPKGRTSGTLRDSYPMLSFVPPLIGLLLLAIIGWTAWGLRADAVEGSPPPGWRSFTELKGIRVTVDRVPPWEREGEPVSEPDPVTVRVFRDDLDRVSEGMGWVDDASRQNHYARIVQLSGELIQAYGSTAAVPSTRFKELRRAQLFGRERPDLFDPGDPEAEDEEL